MFTDVVEFQFTWQQIFIEGSTVLGLMGLLIYGVAQEINANAKLRAENKKLKAENAKLAADLQIDTSKTR